MSVGLATAISIAKPVLATAQAAVVPAAKAAAVHYGSKFVKNAVKGVAVKAAVTAAPVIIGTGLFATAFVTGAVLFRRAYNQQNQRG